MMDDRTDERAPPNSSLAPLESARTKLSNGARLDVGDARAAK